MKLPLQYFPFKRLNYILPRKCSTFINWEGAVLGIVKKQKQALLRRRWNDVARQHRQTIYKAQIHFWDAKTSTHVGLKSNDNCSLITIQGDKGKKQAAFSMTYRNAFGFQNEAWNMPGRKCYPNGIADFFHQMLTEDMVWSHLQEEYHPLLPIFVVLRDTEAIGNLLKGFNWKWRKSPY